MGNSKISLPLLGITGVILIITIVILQKSTLPELKSDFTIETISSTCMTEEHDLDIRALGNSIVIIAPIQTPNPCYSIVGDVKFSGRDIEVDLSAVSKQGICIQCIGDVTGKVVIQNLTKGTYGVEVKTPNKAAITTIMVE